MKYTGAICPEHFSSWLEIPSMSFLKGGHPTPGAHLHDETLTTY